MIADLIARVGQFIIQTIESLGYEGIIILMAVESACIPLPSEIIMPFSGALAQQGRFTLLGISLAGATGSTLGSWVVYFLGWYGGHPLLLKYGKYLLISHHDLARAERFFQRYGWVSLFLGRVMPVIRTYISLPAGISKANFWILTVTSFIGSLIWSFFLGFIGFKLGENWEVMEPYLRKFDLLILAGLVFLILLFLWRRLGRKGLAD